MSTDTDTFRTDQNLEPERYEQEEQGGQEEPGDETPAADSVPYLAESADPAEPEEPVEPMAPEGAAKPEDVGGRHVGADGGPLVAAEAQEEFLSRWSRIQVSFVEDPATAVESADVLVQEIGAAMLASFEDRSGEFAAAGRAASDTEQRRLALRRYHAFIGVLLPE